MTKATIAALAGRRIDAIDAPIHRFPLQNVPIVRSCIHEILATENVELLISSAACGADLIALEEASRLGIRARIVLPYDALQFRRTSVIDRPGSWGVVFDQMIKIADANHELIVMDNSLHEKAAFSAATKALVEEAMREATLSRLAIAVWDRNSRGPDDETANFIHLATEAGMRLKTVHTC